MSPSLTISLIAIVFGVLSFCITDYTRRVYRRRIKQLEKEKAERDLAEAMRRAFIATVAAQAGADLVEPIQVEDIKYGDKVCWHPHDMSDHQHYVAGYDGDPGPSADGVHARPIAQTGL